MLADPRHPVRFVNFVQCLLGSDILSLEGEKKYKTTIYEGPWISINGAFNDLPGKVQKLIQSSILYPNPAF